MIPLVDIHCHLLAGMDDGPRTEADALEMCRLAHAEGIRLAAATAHQNERWHNVTPEGICQGTQRLAQLLREAGLGLRVFPSAEVMALPQMENFLEEGRFQSVAGKGQFFLVEMPHGLFVDLSATAEKMSRKGIRLILAHPERHPEFLHEPDLIEKFIRAGCLVQVSTGSITQPTSREDTRALKSWFKRGIVHLLGTDAHSPRNRSPRMAHAYRQIVRWIGTPLADRIASTNGMAVLNGLPLHVPEPSPRPLRWFAKLW